MSFFNSWGFFPIIVAFGIYEGVTFRLGRRALKRKVTVSPQAIVGCCGKAVTPLAPDGYVKVGGELWRATSSDANIREGAEIVVVEMDRLTLLVTQSSERTTATLNNTEKN